MTSNDASALLTSLSDDELSRLTPDELDDLLSLAEAEQEAAIYDWDAQALPHQRIPGRDLSKCPWVSKEYGAGKVNNPDWNTLMWLCGRGSGKTTTITHNIQELVETGEYKEIGIVSTNANVLREQYGLPIQKLSPPWFKARHIANQSKIVWPNGAQALLLTAEAVEATRGNNFDLLVCDELVAWRKPSTYRTVRAGLRRGKRPLCLVATSAKSTELIWELVKSPATAVIEASTYDNTALTPEQLESVVQAWRGHPDYDAEILGKLYEKIVGSLWTQEQISGSRVTEAPELSRIVVGVDPGAYSANGDDTGVVVCAKGVDGRYYILADYSRAKGTPTEAANAVVSAYNDWQAGSVVVEVNNGGDWIPTVLRSVDPAINIKKVHASTGKLTRAEPISAMYNRGECSHVGTFAELEKQLRTWVPGRGISPGRLDALVFALTELSGRSRELKVY